MMFWHDAEPEFILVGLIAAALVGLVIAVYRFVRRKPARGVESVAGSLFLGALAAYEWSSIDELRPVFMRDALIVGAAIFVGFGLVGGAVLLRDARQRAAKRKLSDWDSL